MHASVTPAWERTMCWTKMFLYELTREIFLSKRAFRWLFAGLRGPFDGLKRAVFRYKRVLFQPKRYLSWPDRPRLWPEKGPLRLTKGSVWHQDKAGAARDRIIPILFL